MNLKFAEGMKVDRCSVTPEAYRGPMRANAGFVVGATRFGAIQRKAAQKSGGSEFHCDSLYGVHRKP